MNQLGGNSHHNNNIYQSTNIIYSLVYLIFNLNNIFLVFNAQNFVSHTVLNFHINLKYFVFIILQIFTFQYLIVDI